MGEHSYKHVSWMKWCLQAGCIWPQWSQLKLYRREVSLCSSWLVLTEQQAFFQGLHWVGRTQD